MRTNYLILICILAMSMMTYSCSKSDSSSSNSSDIYGSKITTNVAGKVIDQNGNGLSGVTITIGTATVNTNASGNFILTNVSIFQNAGFVKASRTGYFTSGKTIVAKENVMNNVVIQLVQTSVSATVANSTGGIVAITGGASIKLGASAVSTSTGATYTGNVNVSAYYLDPTVTDAYYKIPGALRGLDTSGAEKQLVSYGMLVANLTDDGGNALQLATGKTAEITFPIPSIQISTAPATISLWYFDEAKGLWAEQGTATKVGNNYVGTVKHFSWWNCDMGGGPINYTLKFVDSSGSPIVNQHVTFVPADGSSGGGHGMTATDGTITACVPPNKSIKVTMDYSFGICHSAIIYTNTVGPFTSSTDGGTIKVGLGTGTNTSCTISGTAYDCSNNKITNGIACITIDGTANYTNVSNGNFSLTVVRCTNAATTASVFVTNNTSQLQNTSPVTVNVTQGASAPANVIACGTSTAQYLNFTLAGTKYVCDTGFSAFFEQTMVMFSANSSDNTASFWCGFNAPSTTAGTYVVTGIQMSANSITYGLKSMTTTVTEFGSVGQYIAGSFTGSVKNLADSNAAATSITGVYRIKRTQ